MSPLEKNSMNRRRFLQRSAQASALALSLGRTWGAPLASMHVQVKARPDVVIYDGEYPGWPWVTRGGDGSLHCVFREGSVHDYSGNGRALFTKSTDGGRSWGEAIVIADAPGVDDRNTAIVELSGRELLVSYNLYDAARASQAVTVRSLDGGQSWSAPIPLDQPNTRTRSAVLPLTNGDLVLPYYIAPGNGSLAALSKDRGQTWKTVRIPDTDGFLGDEWDALELEPGHLIGVFRNSDPASDGTFWKAESRDGGTHWSRPKPTNVRSMRLTSPPHIAWQNSVPTLIYADRRMVSVSAVTTSDPEFLDWDLANRLPCYQYNPDESPILDSSYPCSVQITPTERLIVDYEIRPEAKRITGYFVQFPEDWGQGFKIRITRVSVANDELTIDFVSPLPADAHRVETRLGWASRGPWQDLPSTIKLTGHGQLQAVAKSQEPDGALFRIVGWF